MRGCQEQEKKPGVRQQAGGVVHFVSVHFVRVLAVMQVIPDSEPDNETVALEAGQHVMFNVAECEMLLRGCVASFAVYCNNHRIRQPGPH